MAFENYKEAFEKFNEIFFKDRKSIFTGKEVLTEQNLDFLKKNFVQNPDAAEDKNFDVKIKEQFEKANDDQKDLMANIIWLWRLPPKKVIARKQYFEKFFENLKSSISNRKNLLICLSISGKNHNVLDIANKFKKNNSVILGISCNESSPLKNLSDYFIQAPTYTNKTSKILPLLVIIDLISCYLKNNKL